MTNITKHRIIDNRKSLQDAYRDVCDNVHLVNIHENLMVSPYIELVENCVQQLNIDPYVLIKIDDCNFDEDMYHQLLSRILAYKNIGVKKFEFIFMRNKKLDIPAMKYIIDAVDDCEYGSIIDINKIENPLFFIQELVNLKIQWLIIKCNSSDFDLIKEIKISNKDLKIILHCDEKINPSDIWFETGVNEIIE